MYIHYWHFANQWYMFISDLPKERIDSGYELDEFEYEWKEKYLIPDSYALTKKQIKERLSIDYPNYTLVREIAYHEGARWFGNKNGCRRYNVE